MRQLRAQTGAAPQWDRRAVSERPSSGYALIVDGQLKNEFESREQAFKTARELKDRYPMLQVAVFDAASGRSEQLELAGA